MNSYSLRYLLPFLHLIIFPLNAFGIVNIESQRLRSDNLGHSGYVNLYLDGRSGTSDKNNFGLSTQLVSTYTNQEVIYILNREYGEANNQVNTDQRFLHFRYMHHLKNEKGLELFSQYEQDRFRDLNSRFLLGAGIRFFPISTDSKTENIFGVGSFYEEEEIIELGNTNFESTYRGNIYWTLKLPVEDHVLFTSSLYYQPSLENQEDQKGLWQLALKVNITSKLSVIMSSNMSYDTDTPEEVEELESRYTTSIRYNF